MQIKFLSSSFLLLMSVLFVSCVSVQNRELAERYYNIATDYYNKKNYTDAVAYYHNALEQNPNLKIVYLNYGLALIETRDFQEAERQLLKAYRVDMENTMGLSALGYLFFQSGNYEQAASWFEKSTKVNPYNPDTFYNLGIALQHNLQYESSKSAFDQIYQLQDPKSAPPEIKHYEALNYLYLGDEEMAINLYNEYFTSRGRSEQAYQGLYNFYIEKKEYQKLVDTMLNLIQTAGGSAISSFLLAEAYYLYLKNSILGKQYLQETVQLGFRDTERLNILLRKLSGSERRDADIIINPPN